MIDERLIDKLVERLVLRIEEGNEYALQKIGESIKKIGALSPSKAQQLAQVLKYGGNYDKIVKKLAEITQLNVKEIYEIFEEVAKNDYAFAKQFYDYRGVNYIPYEQNKALQNQVKALARMTAEKYVNFSNTLAFAKNVNGKMVYTDLSRTYQDTIDKAVLSVAQGKTTFDEQMYSTIKELGSSGLKTIDYASGRSVRLDSSVRQHLKGALRNLHNETQAVFGEEFGSDGVEISVHQNPAPDHALVQGRQFSKEEFDKFQNDRDAIDYKGRSFPAEHNGKDRRSISEHNCYHYTFDIVLGVSKPSYSDEELQAILNDNEKGFELDGEHYTNYQGTQMQRKLETEIRRQKDLQIIAKSSGNDQLVLESQQKITQLTRKYKELSSASGLPTKMDRMRVSGYKRVKIEKNKVFKGIEKPKIDQPITPIPNKNEFFISKEVQEQRNNTRRSFVMEELKAKQAKVKEGKRELERRGLDPKGGSSIASWYRIDLQDVKKLKEEIKTFDGKEFKDKTIVVKDFESAKELLAEVNIDLKDSVKKIDQKLLIDNSTQLYNLTTKYPNIEKEVLRKKVTIDVTKGKRVIANTNGASINLNASKYSNYQKFVDDQKYYSSTNWHVPVKEENLSVHSITHEFGHLFQNRYKEIYSRNRTRVSWQEFDSMTMDAIYSKATRKTKLNRTELKNQYLSNYGKSTRNFEAFAEIYTQMELGQSTPLTEAMREYIEEMDEWF